MSFYHTSSAQLQPNSDLHHFQLQNQFIQRKDAAMILVNSTMMPRNNRVSMHQIESELLFLWAISVENCKVHKVWKFDAIEREMVPICVQNLNIYSTKYAQRRSRNEIPSTSRCSSQVFILMPSTKNIMIWSLQDSFCISYVTRQSYIYWWTKIHIVFARL